MIIFVVESEAKAIHLAKHLDPDRARVTYPGDALGGAPTSLIVMLCGALTAESETRWYLDVLMPKLAPHGNIL